MGDRKLTIDLIMSNPMDQLYTSTAFMAVAILLFLSGLRIYRKCTACRFWPMTDGYILSNKDIPWITEPEKAGKVKLSKVRYSYSVDGVEYISSSLCLGCIFMTRQMLIESAIKYRYGMRVAVQYNPKRPDESILENQDLTKPLLIILFSVIILIPGLILFSNYLLNLTV